MKKSMMFLILIVLTSTILFAGCLTPSGCLPMKVDNKQVITQSLILTISGEEYGYHNPTLTTFNQIEINHTYSMRFQPMTIEKPMVVLCEVKV